MSFLNRIAALCAVACLAAGAHAAPRFTFEAIASPDGLQPANTWGFNNAGQVTGSWWDVAAPVEIPLLYTPGAGYQNLTPPGASDAYAYALNDAGQVVGSAGGRAWQFGPSGGRVPGVPDVPSVAAAINNAGVVVGSYGQDDTSRAFVAVPGQALRSIDLEYGAYAHDINDRGEVLVGQVGGPIGPVYRYDIASGALDRVGGDQEAGATIARINNQGAVAAEFGFRYDAHISVYDAEGQRTDIAGLPGYMMDSLGDFNDRGQILGASFSSGPGIPFESAAFLYTPGEGAVELMSLLDVPTGWEGLRFGYLNDRGDILGGGTFNGAEQLFMLRALAAPVPEPGTAILLLAGVVLVGVTRARRRAAAGRP